MQRGFSLVELVIVLVVSGIVFVTAPPLLSHGVRTMVFLPRAVAVNQASAAILHQIVEGGFSHQTGQAVSGLRFGIRRSATERALWLAEGSRIGYRTPDGQLVLIRLVGNTIRRSFPTAASCSPPDPIAEEVIPYDAAERDIRVGQIDLSTSLFRYYNQAGTWIQYPNCEGDQLFVIRRVDIAFIAQTGSGDFNEGQARERITSSVAIRVP